MRTKQPDIKDGRQIRTGSGSVVFSNNAQSNPTTIKHGFDKTPSAIFMQVVGSNFILLNLSSSDAQNFVMTASYSVNQVLTATVQFYWMAVL